jgi:hypothetical protein
MPILWVKAREPNGSFILCSLALALSQRERKL